ncbi:thermonuclease family protein [Nitrosopumilus sp.]|uniref:thermonuclease family protein n=1 Tax=Nitrosopumilus sp. TaxID=2024843 RepID=UPI003D10F6C3
MNTKLLRNLGIASAVVIVTIFGIGLVEQQEQEIEPVENQIEIKSEPVENQIEIKSEPVENQIEIKSTECSGNALCFSGKITQIIDGDTVKVDGKSIRFALVDAPELKYDGGQAKQFVEQVCPVGSEVIVDQDDDQLVDKYGRMLGVIYCNDMNLNKEILDSGIGDLYSAFCDQSEFATHSWATKHGCNNSEDETNQQTQNCDSSYPDFCIPSSPPDLDCGDISQKDFTVFQPDPHKFDGDNDGIGCES